MKVAKQVRAERVRRRRSRRRFHGALKETGQKIRGAKLLRYAEILGWIVPVTDTDTRMQTSVASGRKWCGSGVV